MAKSSKPRKASAKKSAVPKAAKQRKVSEKVLAARRQAEAFAGLPPNFPVIPFADTLVGREFYARVNCKVTPNRKGKLVNRCDTQRVTVIGGATPSADKPKRKQVFAVQKGQRYIVPDREIKRSLRATPAMHQHQDSERCESLQEYLDEGSYLPQSAYDECPRLVARDPLPSTYEPMSSDPWDVVERKANHHDGYHAAGDPFGVYLPPLGQWNPTAENLPRLGQAYIHNGKKLWFLAEVREWHHPQLGWSFFVFRQRSRGYCAEVVDRAHGDTSLVALDGFPQPSEAYHALRQWYSTQSAPKRNRSTKGVPGGSYFSDRADAWIGQSVGGDDFAGEIRARALTSDGSPAHVVGGHVMTRSRAAAGARREDIRTGVLPAPVKRHKAPEVVATVRGERIESFPVRELPARVPMRGLPARVPVRMPTMQPPPMAAPRSQFGVPELEAARPRPSRFGVPGLEAARPRPSRFGVPGLEAARPRPSRFGVPGLEAARPRPVARPAPVAVAPRRASDEELMRAMLEELALAGIVVKQNRPTHRRY